MAREFFERAVLFLVKNEEVRGLGGFGAAPREENAEPGGARGRDPAHRAVGFPAKSVTRRKPFAGAMPEGKWTELPDRQDRAVQVGGGWPCFPLLTHRETIAMLYGDNPETGRALGRLEALEVFINQAGIALENAFLQRKIQALQQP